MLQRRRIDTKDRLYDRFLWLEALYTLFCMYSLLSLNAFHGIIKFKLFKFVVYVYLRGIYKKERVYNRHAESVKLGLHTNFFFKF